MTDVRAIEPLVGFTRALRAAGLDIDGAHDFIEATSRLDLSRRPDVYWAGRATLCSGPEDTATYDRVFDRWFRADRRGRPGPPTQEQPRKQRQAALDEAAGQGDEGERRDVAVLATAEERLRHRDVADLTEPERRHLARLFARLQPLPPTRLSRRRSPHSRGEVDRARTTRDQLRRAGEPGPLRHRRPRRRERRVVFLVDVSGSMESYADSLLRLAHRVVAVNPRRTEVFTVGTRLTRVTPALRAADPERALELAGRAVPDWSGGTRLGEVIRAFLDRWGQRGLARGAVVVIASDGWERGDPELLGEQMARLRRLAHTVIWSNPHRGRAGYAPIQGGIVAALPYVDGLVAGHSFAAFAEILEMVADA